MLFMCFHGYCLVGGCVYGRCEEGIREEFIPASAGLYRPLSDTHTYGVQGDYIDLYLIYTPMVFKALSCTHPYGVQGDQLTSILYIYPIWCQM